MPTRSQVLRAIQDIAVEMEERCDRLLGHTPALDVHDESFINARVGDVRRGAEAIFDRCDKDDEDDEDLS